MTKVTCRWCGKEFDYDAGYYYHEHECHARDVRRRIKLLKDGHIRAIGVYEAARTKLQVELEEAEYVGD